MTWTDSIQYLPGVGPRRAQLLEAELEVRTVGDLVRLYPFRFVDRSAFTPIAEVRPDLAQVQIRATVRRVTTVAGARGGRLSVWVGDESGEMELVFFKGVRYMAEKLVPGTTMVFFGKPTLYGGRVNMVHPEVDTPAEGGVKGALTGVYPSTEKLKASGVTGKVMLRMVGGALEALLPTLEETLPGYLLERHGLVPLAFALRQVHFPQSQEALEKAQRRLKFEELFLLELSLLRQKFVRSRAAKGWAMPHVGEAFHACYQALPFPLTGAQQRVIREIREDMVSGRQMNRLLQGDVGSGKTLVALLSALIAVGNGFQACIMAPTEVLAQQHFASLSRYLAPTGVRVALLTGSTPAGERRTLHEGLRDGTLALLVGTHALIEDEVQFRRLGLAIVDEQHRFGVEQRARLWGKGAEGIPPHVLVMTATPIPRTLAMTLYGDLDVSVIDELPPGRKPVRTLCVGEGKRAAMYRFIRDQVAAGRQAFIVYPLIFESEKMDLRNLETGYEEVMKAFPPPAYKVALVHGRQTAQERDFNMGAFVAGRADILVSTTVIEVGVDVPNASVMVIEDAERFGLSQLHQLRGRVGRGAEESFCILMRGTKVSRESRKRLELLCSTQDGFALAEEDIKLRGPGDLGGTAQSGLPVALHAASLVRDASLLAEARDAAAAVLEDDPQLDWPENALLLRTLRREKGLPVDYSRIS